MAMAPSTAATIKLAKWSASERATPERRSDRANCDRQSANTVAAVPSIPAVVVDGFFDGYRHHRTARPESHSVAVLSAKSGEGIEAFSGRRPPPRHRPG
jgi:hypothetical protein